MGTVIDAKGSNLFCDEVYTELAGMKKRIIEMRDKFSRSKGEDKKMFGIYEQHEQHLSQLVADIDWKLQILSHSCSYGWKGSDDYEGNVQVDEAMTPQNTDFSPGYLGG